jgi:putative membrane protein
MGLFGLFIAGLIIWAVIMATQKGTSFNLGGAEKRTPLDIARERYAKGEITMEEFETIKKNLR